MSIPALAEAPIHPLTRLLYLQNSALVRSHARVLEVCPKGDGSVGVVMDQSPFYPQQGGQPSDVGTLRSERGEVAVSHVRAGAVSVHTGRVVRGAISAGDEVVAEIDAGMRRLHTRIHSAGELLCAVAGELGVGGAAVMGAIHHPHRASVDFSLPCIALPPQDFGTRLEAGVNRRIAEGGAVRLLVVSDIEAVAEFCGYRPDYLATGEPVRIVFMGETFGRPCLGTHVADIGEIGPVRVRKIKVSKGRLTVSYHLDGMLLGS